MGRKRNTTKSKAVERRLDVWIQPNDFEQPMTKQQKQYCRVVVDRALEFMFNNQYLTDEGKKVMYKYWERYIKE